MPSKNSHVLKLRAGEIVQVRTESEVLATLDERGTLDALPFMPEMLKYCGKTFRVFKRADKTCDTIQNTGSRRLKNVVHLDGLRCDGQFHGGCQAGCLMFWKEAWLKRVHPGSEKKVTTDDPAFSQDRTTSSTILALMNTTHTKEASVSNGETFVCQVTELTKASSYLAWWDVRQYIRDVRSGNVRLLEFVRAVLIRLFNEVQTVRGGCRYPYIQGKLKKTPSGVLDLTPGELVQVKTKDEIVGTLDLRNRNRGLLFDKEEVPYCGKTFRVLRRVERIIDEASGQMIVLPNDCVILEGVTCGAYFSEKRLFCPRSIYPFWREIWLKRVE